MNRIAMGLVIGIGVAGAARGASAQEVAAVEGPGYPLSESTVVHPILGAEAGFTDNVFYEDANQNPSGLLRLIAEAALASKEIESEEPIDPLLADPGDEAPAEPAHQAMTYRASGRLTYNEYLSSNSTTRAQRTLGAELAGNLVVAPQGRFSFTADEHFLRDTRPTNFESTDGTNRVANQLGLALRFQPGGRTMAGILKWENQIDYFEDSDQRFANRMINAVHGRYEWAFFPYSKVFADVSYGFIGGLGGDDTIKRSANPIRGGVGIATSITEIFTVKAHAGWAYAAYSGGASYNAPVAGVELGYRYSPVGRFVVEYNWDHRDSVNADYYRDHHFGAHIDHQFDRLVASARGEMRLRGYRGINPMIGPSDRDDLIFSVGVRAQYVLKDWMAIVGDYHTDVDQTDYMSDVGGGLDDPSFVRHEVTAGVRAAF